MIPTVVSAIALGASGIALVCVFLLLIISKAGTGQGGIGFLKCRFFGYFYISVLGLKIIREWPDDQCMD